MSNLVKVEEFKWLDSKLFQKGDCCIRLEGNASLNRTCKHGIMSRAKYHIFLFHGFFYEMGYLDLLGPQALSEPPISQIVI